MGTYEIDKQQSQAAFIKRLRAALAICEHALSYPDGRSRSHAIDVARKALEETGGSGIVDNRK